MSSAVGIPDTHQPTDHEDLYYRDHYAWATEQADALSRRDFDAIDWAHITEEIQALVRGEESSLRSQYVRTIEHFLKLQYWPASDTDPIAGWETSIQNARGEIKALLDDSPSLMSRSNALFQHAWPLAKSRAITALVDSSTARIADPSIRWREQKRLRREWHDLLPSRNPYTLPQAQDLDWRPQAITLTRRPATRHHLPDRSDWTR